MPKFKDYPEFNPNLSPKEMFDRGVFGGTYFRDIYSSVTKQKYKNTFKEFPDSWFKKFPVNLSECDKSINKYNVTSGTSLEYWEDKGWIHPDDPYGWVQWYCRFYLGRRGEDDERQIKRWEGIAGDNGRFKRRLENMVSERKDSPKIRQLLLQWAFEFR